MTDDIVRLDDICESLFGMKPQHARRKAAINQLPVPTFRLNNTRKGPLLVRRSDLDALAKTVIAAASAEHKLMATVTPDVT